MSEETKQSKDDAHAQPQKAAKQPPPLEPLPLRGEFPWTERNDADMGLVRYPNFTSAEKGGAVVTGWRLVEDRPDAAVVDYDLMPRK